MRFYSMNIKEFTWVKSSYSLHYYQIKLVRNIFGSKHHAIKQKLMPHILLEHSFLALLHSSQICRHIAIEVNLSSDR